VEATSDIVWLEQPPHLADQAPAEPEPLPDLEPIAELEPVSEPEPAPPPRRASTPRASASVPRAPLFTPRRSADKSWPASPPPDRQPVSTPAPPRRRMNVGLVAGIVVVLLGGGGAAVILTRGRAAAAPDTTAHRPAAVATPAPAPTDSTPPRADSTVRADSAAAAPAAAAPAAPAPTIGFLRLSGDLPDDAVISLDGEEMSGLFLRATPGRHEIDIESQDFLPWSRTVTVRAGDTLRVRIDLELKPDSTQN
jgi:PEGA domain-containing protein